jgi:hypothetical protein
VKCYVKESIVNTKESLVSICEINSSSTRDYSTLSIRITWKLHQQKSSVWTIDDKHLKVREKMKEKGLKGAQEKLKSNNIISLIIICTAQSILHQETYAVKSWYCAMSYFSSSLNFLVGKY